MKLNKRGLILINEMIGTKSFLIKTLPLVLIVFSVFTISSVIDAEGFASKSTKGWTYELAPGESQVFTWTLINGEDKQIKIEFRSEGKGSDFFTFEKSVIMEGNSKQAFEFIVSIPEDHPNNIEYRPDVYAIEKALRDSTGGAQVLINYEMVAHPIIKIGDNPIYTPPPAPVLIEEEPKVVEEERPSKEDFEVVREETLEEKLKRIQEANEATKVDDDFEESFEEEAVPDYQPEPEYELEPKDIVTPTEKTMVEEKKECNFIDWLLSLFGIGTCE